MSVKSYHQNNGSTLWMGDIDDSMDERFIKTSFNLMGRNPTHVRVVRKKFNGPIGYGFVTFDSEEMAQSVLQEVNGQPMPNSAQGKRFRLNKTSNHSRDEEFSIYVGDLTPDVDDVKLLNAFIKHYPSVCSAKVMVSDGQSRRFGFVRFNLENDYRKALVECHNSNMLGPNPISVKAAKPRRIQRFPNYSQYKPRTYDMVNTEVYVPPQPTQQAVETPETTYASEMESYYNGAAVPGQPVWVYPMMPYNALPLNYEPYVYGQQPVYGQQAYYPTCDNVTYSLIPTPIYVDHGHNQFLESDKLNDEIIVKNEDFYSSIENGRWSTPDADKEAKMQ